MKKADGFLITACALATLFALGHLSFCAKAEFDISFTDHTLGLDTPQYVALWHKIIISHLLQAFWFALISVLILASILRKRNSN